MELMDECIEVYMAKSLSFRKTLIVSDQSHNIVHLRFSWQSSHFDRRQLQSKLDSQVNTPIALASP